MKAVILCGAQGSRIREVSELLPTPVWQSGAAPWKTWNSPP